MHSSKPRFLVKAIINDPSLLRLGIEQVRLIDEKRPSGDTGRTAPITHNLPRNEARESYSSILGQYDTFDDGQEIKEDKTPLRVIRGTRANNFEHCTLHVTASYDMSHKDFDALVEIVRTLSKIATKFAGEELQTLFRESKNAYSDDGFYVQSGTIKPDTSDTQVAAVLERGHIKIFAIRDISPNRQSNDRISIEVNDVPVNAPSKEEIFNFAENALCFFMRQLPPGR